MKPAVDRIPGLEAAGGPDDDEPPALTESSESKGDEEVDEKDVSPLPSPSLSLCSSLFDKPRHEKLTRAPGMDGTARDPDVADVVRQGEGRPMPQGG